MGPVKARAFSLVEAIVFIMLIGIVAVMTVPRLNFAAIPKQKARCAARKIVADLRRTRRLAISDAANNPDGFELRIIGGSGHFSYEIVDLNTSLTVDVHTIDPEVSCSNGDTFQFGPLGNLKDGSATELNVYAEGTTLTITIVPATGTIKCAEN
jgi:Tfp pilus assembly protein FimT